ncbi:MAG: hypothetical protein LBO00_09915 [Zoogloeaceae bacterium]|jgi:citrate lyase gamma subunit|nr:hypothetical protein [Zoogloeaceae bacterium]
MQHQSPLLPKPKRRNQSQFILRNFGFLLLVAAVFLLPGNASSFSGKINTEDESKIDTDFMQSVEDTGKSLVDNIGIRDADASVTDATELETMFAAVEEFYVAKGGDDVAEAIKLSRKSRDLSKAIIEQLGRQGFDEATATATELQRTCKACHNFYKDV